MKAACPFTVVLLVWNFCVHASAAEPLVLNVWPERPPGETKELPPEQDVNKPEDKLIGGRPIVKLTNVSTPQIAVYRPAEDKQTGTAIVICPGGGHHILAYDHEGTEVAEWLNGLGVTAIVLKYRVPARETTHRWQAAVQDAQRTMSLVRSKADELGVDPERIGILGFSAGGETAGLTALFLEDRKYGAIDQIDQVSSRPDFAVLVYPGNFIDKDTGKLRDYIRVTKEMPPTFFVHSQDDNVPVQNSLLLALELKDAGVPTELHIYATGGHGFGMRDTGEPVNTWPERCEEWMRRQGWLKPAVTKE